MNSLYAANTLYTMHNDHIIALLINCNILFICASFISNELTDYGMAIGKIVILLILWQKKKEVIKLNRFEIDVKRVVTCANTYYVCWIGTSR